MDVDDLIKRLEDLDKSIDKMNVMLRVEQDEIQQLQRDYDNLLVDLDQSGNNLGAIGEDIGVGSDDRLDNDILYEFEKYVDANGLRIGTDGSSQSGGGSIGAVAAKRPLKRRGR